MLQRLLPAHSRDLQLQWKRFFYEKATQANSEAGYSKHLLKQLLGGLITKTARPNTFSCANINIQGSRRQQSCCCCCYATASAFCLRHQHLNVPPAALLYVNVPAHTHTHTLRLDRSLSSHSPVAETQRERPQQQAKMI